VLRRETDFWIRELALGRHETVFSLVQPFHIYGFLHALLVPWFSGATVMIADGGLAGVDENAMLRADVVVGVPAVWPLMAMVLKGGQARRIVSSGATLGVDRVAECGQIFFGRPKMPRLLEILGSSETGGIGWRDVTEGGDPAFRPMPGVAIQFDDDPQTVVSPFLFPEGSRFGVSDRLVPADESCFRHGGRADRVF
jgi:acyl-coenzyme A synthetase/AMP-(fatty) acid ligase